MTPRLGTTAVDELRATKKYRIPRGETLMLFRKQPPGGASVARLPFWTENSVIYVLSNIPLFFVINFISYIGINIIQK